MRTLYAVMHQGAMRLNALAGATIPPDIPHARGIDLTPMSPSSHPQVGRNVCPSCLRRALYHRLAIGDRACGL